MGRSLTIRYLFDSNQSKPIGFVGDHAAAQVLHRRREKVPEGGAVGDLLTAENLCQRVEQVGPQLLVEHSVGRGLRMLGARGGVPTVQGGPTELDSGNGGILYAVFSTTSLKQHT